MGVLRPLRVVLENYPEGSEDAFDAPWYPEDASRGGRVLPFSRVLYVDADDFAEAPPKGWFRLSPGTEVRLRHACIIKCQSVVKDAEGRVIELRCTWDPDSRGGNPRDGRKIKGTLHWVSERHSVPAEARLYDRLFAKERPGEEGDDFLQDINPKARETIRGARLEPALAGARRLLLRRPRLQARRDRPQPHHRPSRLLGREAREVETEFNLSPRPWLRRGGDRRRGRGRCPR
jgi:glutaminyl-tRNA synthetase